MGSIDGRPAAATGARGLLRAWCTGVVAATAVLLAACGGGGGGGGGANGGTTTPAETFSIALDRTSIEATWSEGTTPTSPVLQATGKGQTTRTIFVGAAAATGGTDPNISRLDVVLTGTNASVTVVPTVGLPVGRYTGSLLLRACYDNACAEQVSGSPVTVSYTFTVQASPLRTDPTALDITAFAGELAQRSFTVVGATADKPLKVTPRDTWLRASVQAGTGDPVVQVEATAGAAGSTTTTAIDVENNGLKFTLPVTLRSVPQRLTLSTKRLVKSTTLGSTGCSATVSVVKLAAGASRITASTTAAWFSLPAVTAAGFTLQQAPLPPGTYDGTVVVRSGGDVEVLPVRCTVTNPAGTVVTRLGLGRLRITLWAPEGGTSATESLNLLTPSWDRAVQASVTYAQGQDWLRVLAPTERELQVVANATGLAAGVYDATVTVTGAYPSPPWTSRVRLTVGNPLATPAQQSTTLGSESSAATFSRTIQPVGRADLVAWTATTSTPWLKLTTASGSMSTPLAYTIDRAQALALQPYTDIPASITLQATTSSGATVGPVTAQVPLRVELAEVSSVGPGTVVAGEAVDVIVRGRGFNRLDNPAARFQVNGAAALSVTVISDTAMAVRLPALPAGDAVLAVTNVFDIDTPKATLKVQAPAAAPAAALATGGSPWSLVQDPRRRQLFVANPALGAIQRWREQSGAWVADKLDVTDLADIGLTVDGSTLVATRARGQVLLIDPVAFTVLSTHDAPARLYPLPKLGTGLAITNDARVWLTTIDSKPITFDIATRTFTEPLFDGVQTAFNGGPWFMAARNGERIVAVQAAGTAPMLAMDASVGQWRANPVDLNFFYWPLNGLGDNGRRLLVMGGVWEGDYTAVGRQLLPDAGWIDSAAALSPDGNRLYVLALPPSWNVAGSAALPKVHVFDASVNEGTNAALPLLGSITLPEYPTCRTQSGTAGECLRPAMAVSPDGKTVFIAGEARLVVLPVPAEFDTLTLTVVPKLLDFTASQATGGSLGGNASVRPLPAGTVYPFVLVDKPLFVEGRSFARVNEDSSVGFSVQARAGLAPGVYEGVLTVKLCKDAACAASWPLKNDTVPYKLTVAP